MTTMDFDFSHIFSSFINTSVYTVDFIIYTGNAITHRETRNGPEDLLKQTFLNTMKQIGQEKRPMTLRMEIPKIQYSQNLDKDIEVIDYVEFKNKYMVQAENEST